MKKIRYIDRETGLEKVEIPPGEAFLKFLYHHPFGGLALNVLVKRKFLSETYGRMMNGANSTKRIKPFVDRLGIDMSESLKSIDEFASFNDFFYRKLKPNLRPIQEGIVSPGDGKVIAFESIGDVNEFFVKGTKFTLKAFLANDALAKKYQDSSMFIIRLAPNDYHRFHFPYSGLASQPYKIKGAYFSVSPYALAANFTKVFCENKREFTILKTHDKGDILISPVGATMVGSIVETYQSNTEVAKGDEMGYFAFGGSTIVLLVDRQQVQIDADILANTKKGMETSIRMGERMGL
ncbi:MAG: phosphatidylserine decarboxylase [Flammeovirgaceae bacterium]